MARKKKRAPAQRSAAAGKKKIQSTGGGAASKAKASASGATSKAKASASGVSSKAASSAKTGASSMKAGASSMKTGAAATTAGVGGASLSGKRPTGKRLKGRTSSVSASGQRLSGWRRYAPPNGKGKYPWRKRWLGLIPIAGLALFGGWWGWDHVEDRLDERAMIHLACDGIDADELDMDWSYRDVTIEGQLPAGVTVEDVERTIDEGSTNTDCLEQRAEDAGVDLDPDADPGVYDVNVAALAAAPLVVPTAEPEPTAVPTAVPAPTATAVPEPTATAVPEPTATAAPEPTAVPIAVALDTQGGYDGRTITLAGVVASEAQRQTLVDAATASVGAGNVIDELEIDEARAADGNDGLVGDLASVVGLFGDELLEGSARLADGALTWDVLARDQDIADGLSLPGTGTLDVAAPQTPTFTG